MVKNTRKRRNGKRSHRGYSRKNRFTGLLVIVILLLFLLLVALLLGSKEAPEFIQPKKPDTISVATNEATSAPVAAQTPLPEAGGEYDLAGIPPLFNATHFIPDSYVLDLADIGGGHSMQAPAAKAFNDMIQAAAGEGLTIYPISGYRSHQHQTNNYNSKIQSYLAQNYSEDEARRMTEDYIAIPGTSEHEAGLAVDVNSLYDSFDQTPEFEWLQNNAAKYGFIFRYRKETKAITGIAYEPWHYRFVGANHAAKIQELGFSTLEEYIDYLNS